jgi:uncharacterized protein
MCKPRLTMLAAACTAAAVLCFGAVQARPLDDAQLMLDRGDVVTAFRLYAPLADAGDREAQYQVGLMYDKGEGVERDYAEAAKSYRMAAEQGLASAQYVLGTLYAVGKGVPRDAAAAAMWFSKAADQGRADAQFRLANLFDKGSGVPQDYIAAHKWYNIAASRFPSAEADRTGLAVLARDWVASKMTQAELAQAWQLARNWTPR